jgi:hypothetical protein
VTAVLGVLYTRQLLFDGVISGNGNRWHPAGVNRWLRKLETEMIHRESPPSNPNSLS